MFTYYSFRLALRRQWVAGSCLTAAQSFRRLLNPLCSLLSLAIPCLATANAQHDTIHLGIADTLTRNVSNATMRTSRPAVALLMQRSTGIPFTVHDPLPSQELANQLAKDRVQLGVFPGVEFAWERAKHPDLRPLAIVVNHHRDRQAVLVVRAENPADDVGDLKDMVLALPSHSPEHCRLFLEGSCRSAGQKAEILFARIDESATVEDALDDLVDGSVGAAVIDRAGLNAYARRKPGRFGKLKAVVTSARFPDTVIAYHDGALDKATIERLRQGLRQADKTPEGKNLLTSLKATRFELPPADYDKLLVEILKTNPDPHLISQK